MSRSISATVGAPCIDLNSLVDVVVISYTLYSLDHKHS